jgi:proteasome accessory factor C
VSGAGRGQAPRMVTSAERLRRLLALVPYVATRRAVGLAEAAETFGMTERELIDDLNLAWCVELKAPEPYCPIDLSYEDGEITISQAESIARPLRLAADEASALLVALRVLAEVGVDSSAVARLIAKIEAAAGAAGTPSSQLSVQIESPNVPGVSATLAAALSAGKRVHLRYYVPRRDEETERDVDPMRMLVVEGRPYLEGWCRHAEGVRMFHLDRVLSVDVLDLPAEVPEEAEERDVDGPLFQPSESDLRAELDLAPDARWVAEYNPCESVTELGEGRLRVVLRSSDTGFVRRLALRLGEDARVASPAALAAEVREAAAAALALYEDELLAPDEEELLAEQPPQRRGVQVGAGQFR